MCQHLWQLSGSITPLRNDGTWEGGLLTEKRELRYSKHVAVDMLFAASRQLLLYTPDIICVLYIFFCAIDPSAET